MNSSAILIGEAHLCYGLEAQLCLQLFPAGSQGKDGGPRLVLVS